MGAKATREAEAQRLAEVDAWHARLQRYFHKYNLKPNPHRTAALVGRIVEDRAVWIALLTKYGPELDPPFDQPLAPASLDVGVKRRRLHITSAAVLPSKEHWVRRLKRFFGKYKPSMSEADIRVYVAAIPFAELPVAWEVLLEQYGPEPLGAIETTTADAGSDRRSFKSVGSAVANAVELASRCEFKADSLRLLRSRGQLTSLRELDELLEQLDGNLNDCLAVINERAARGKPNSAQAVISKQEWFQLIAELEPNLDFFEIETLMEDHGRRTSGISGLFRQLVEVKRQPKARAVSIAVMTPLEFWMHRVTSYLRHFGKPPTLDEEAELRARLTFSGYRDVWNELQARFGPEPTALTKTFSKHREFWAHRIACVLHEKFPRNEWENVAKARQMLMDQALPREWQDTYIDVSSELGGDGTTEAKEAIEAATGAARRLAAADRLEWVRKLVTFYETHDPSRVDGVEGLLDKAMKHPGGVARMWELLLHKYGVKENTTAVKELKSDPKDEPDADAATTQESPAGSPIVQSETTHSPAKQPIPVAPITRDNRELWLLRANLLRLAAGINLPWHFFEKKVQAPFDVSYSKLQAEFQSWDPPKVDNEFWMWRAQRLVKQIRSEFPLVSVPEKPTGFELYTALRSRFHGDGLKLHEAFEAYYREKESRHEVRFGWMKTQPDQDNNIVGSRRFWEKKFFDFRNANCPRMSDATVINALDLGEVRGLQWERVFEGFVRQSVRYSSATSAPPD